MPPLQSGGYARARSSRIALDEGLEFLRQIPEFGSPLPQLILTVGSTARRGLFPLIDEARRLGIRVSITPAATPALTFEMLAKLKAHGVGVSGLASTDQPPKSMIPFVVFPAPSSARWLRWAGCGTWICPSK